MKEILRALDLGNSVAEFDDSLGKYFVENEAFQALVSGRVDIVAGDKGTGKTALYRILQKRYASLAELTVEPIGDAILLWRAAERLGIESDAAAPAEAAGLIEVGARVRFRHPLVRSAACRAATVRDLQEVHGALADATDAGLDPDRRAWHRAARGERTRRGRGRGARARRQAACKIAAASRPQPRSWSARDGVDARSGTARTTRAPRRAGQASGRRTRRHALAARPGRGGTTRRARPCACRVAPGPDHSSR